MPELAAPPAVTPALAVEGLSYRYPRLQRDALAGVSLGVGAGEFLVLAGRSASGKTTLLRAACGLVPHFHGGAISGRVSVAGRDTRESGPSQLARVVGYVSQDPESQVVSTTVAAEIELPLELRGESGPARARAVEEVALALAIPHLLPRTTDSLSGGELQRVALAAALVTRPRLVLLDEPTSQLDPVAGDELIWLLRRLNEEWGVAILLAEHRLERCLAAADRVIAMDAGKISFDGPPQEFLAWSLDHDPPLATPGAHLFSLAGLTPLPVGVRAARATLAEQGVGALEAGVDAPSPDTQRERPSLRARLRPRKPSSSRPGRGFGARPPLARRPSSSRPGRGSGARSPLGDSPSSSPPERGSGARPPLALTANDLWVELDRGDELHDVLKGVDLRIEPGEKVALMGRNGAGKSTLLRTAAGLVEPVHGKIEVPGGSALLTQSPGDFLVRERVADELPGEAGLEALRAVGLEAKGDADPRDLSGGERQRLALAITLAGREQGSLPGLVALDEPTRGMDRARKGDLAELIERLAGQGAAVVVATHDVEFAAGFAERVLLLGDGRLIADGRAQEILAGGWYFATEVARILDRPGVIAAEQGAELLRSEL